LRQVAASRNTRSGQLAGNGFEVHRWSCRIVRHVGSARDDAELGLLIEVAQRLSADDAQRELNLGMTPENRFGPYGSTTRRWIVHRRCGCARSAGAGGAAAGDQKLQRVAL
jgi:hypothetical protein